MIMKKKKYLILFLCASLFAACQKDDIVKINDVDERIPGNLPEPERDGLMYDGRNINTYILYCIDSPMHKYDESVKTIDDYSKMRLSLEEKYQSRELNINDQERIPVARMRDDYYRQKTAFIYNEYMIHFDKALNGWVFFLTAYINGEESITCDKVLWGEEPGTDLKKHFLIQSYACCMPVGIENPKLLYNYGEMPESMSDFCPMEAWLQEEYDLILCSEPEERYDELTFTLTLPVKIEHTYDYILAKYRGDEDAELKTTEEVFTSQCTVKFNWK
jgi:hypothetical protein